MVTPEARGLAKSARHQRTRVHMKVRIVGVRRVWDCILCPSVTKEGGDGEGVDLEEPSLPSYTLRYVSLAELGSVSRVGLREPMHLCAYMDRGEDCLNLCCLRTKWFYGTHWLVSRFVTCTLFIINVESESYRQKAKLKALANSVCQKDI